MIPEFFIGVAFYAINALTQSQCSTALSAFRGVDHKAIVLGWEFFGTNRSCLERFTNLNGRKTVEVHLRNGTCQHARRKCRAEIGGSLSNRRLNSKLEDGNSSVSRRLRSRARHIAEFFGGKEVALIVSLGLEESYSPMAARKVKEMIKEEIPYAKVARNSLNRLPDSELSKYDYIELHSDNADGCPRKAKSCIFTNDGWNLSLPRQRKDRRNLNISDLYATIFRSTQAGNSFYYWFDAQGLAACQYCDVRDRVITLHRKDVAVINKELRAMQ